MIKSRCTISSTFTLHFCGSDGERRIFLNDDTFLMFEATIFLKQVKANYIAFERISEIIPTRKIY